MGLKWGSQTHGQGMHRGPNGGQGCLGMQEPPWGPKGSSLWLSWLLYQGETNVQDLRRQVMNLVLRHRCAT